MTTKRLTTVTEPITAAEVKTLMPLDGTDQDSRIAILIPALRQRAEQITGRAFCTGNFSLTLDAFPDGEVLLHSGPVTAMVSLAYTDTLGAAQTILAAGYQLDMTSIPARLLPAVDTVWPDTQDIANAVTITYTAGATSAEVKAWIAVMIRAEIDGMETPTYLDGLLDALKVY